MIAPLLGLLAAGGLSALNTQGGLELQRYRARNDAQSLLTGLEGQGMDVDPGVAAALQSGQVGLGQDLLTQQDAQRAAMEQINRRGTIQGTLQGQSERARGILQEDDQEFRREMAERGYQMDAGLLNMEARLDAQAAGVSPLSIPQANTVSNFQDELDSPFQSLTQITDYAQLFLDREREGTLGKIGSGIGELVPFTTSDQELANAQRQQLVSQITFDLFGSTTTEAQEARVDQMVPTLSDLSENRSTALGKLEILQAEVKKRARDKFRNARNFEMQTGRQLFNYNPEYMNILERDSMTAGPGPGFERVR